jgi:hypothetical protein
MHDLADYVNDMLAVEREIHQAFSRQKRDDDVKVYTAAHQLIARVEDTIDRHIEALAICLRRLGADESMMKKAVGAAMGFAAGLFDKIRDDKVSRILRDDYAALSFASVCYQMLHTTALAMKETETAELALRHLKDFTPQIVDLSEVLPQTLVEELTREGKIPANATVVREAVRNTRAAWETAAHH